MRYPSIIAAAGVVLALAEAVVGRTAMTTTMGTTTGTGSRAARRIPAAAAARRDRGLPGCCA
jgi:hypothetical protein